MLLSANISGIYDGEKASKKRATLDTADFFGKSRSFNFFAGEVADIRLGVEKETLEDVVSKEGLWRFHRNKEEVIFVLFCTLN